MQVTCIGIKCDEVSIESGNIDGVMPDGNTTVLSATAQRDIVGNGTTEFPKHGARSDVECCHSFGRLRDEHSSRYHDGTRFQGWLARLELSGPGQAQVPDIQPGNLVLLAVPLTRVTSCMRKPFI